MSPRRGGRRSTKSKVEALDKAIKTMEKAAEVIENSTGIAEQEPSVLLQEFEPISEDDAAQEEIEDLFGSLPHNEDFYLKIYKRKPLPANVRGPEFKTAITDTKSITDLEVMLQDLVRENKWGSGEYEVQALRVAGSEKSGRPKRLARPVIISIDCPPEKKEAQSVGLEEELGKTSRIVDLVRGIVPPQQTTSDLTRCLTDTFKSSIETMKSIMPPRDGNGNSQAITLEIIKSLKEAGVFGKDTSKPISLDDVIKLLPVAITAFKDLCQPVLGIFQGQKKEDGGLLEGIKQLRETGLIKIAGEEKEKDPIDTISKVVEMMSVLKPLMGGGDEGNTSPIIELIRTVGPHVPGIVENVTGTINNVAEVARLKLARQMGVRPENLAPRITTEKKEPLPPAAEGEPKPEIIPATKEEGIVTMRNPLIQEVFNAIEKNDTGYYPKLKQLIAMNAGNQFLEALITGTATPEMFCSAYADALKEPELNSEKPKAYLAAFVEWCRAEEEKNLIVAKCKTCGVEIEFMSEEEWNQDTKKCPDCGGDLERIEISQETQKTHKS